MEIGKAMKEKVIPNWWNIYNSSLNIRRICYKEKPLFPRFKWIEDPYNLFSWHANDLWDDGIMQCKNKRASTNETHGETRNIWKSSRASVSGRHTTAKLGGVPRYRITITFIFTVFLSSILLVVFWSSRIKFMAWSSCEFCFIILLCNRVRELYNKY